VCLVAELDGSHQFADHRPWPHRHGLLSASPDLLAGNPGDRQVGWWTGLAVGAVQVGSAGGFRSAGGSFASAVACFSASAAHCIRPVAPG